VNDIKPAEQTQDVFGVLSKIDVSKYIEKKGKLDYLSWARAWLLVKQNFPSASFSIFKSTHGLNYHHDNRTAWVEVEVTIDNLSLPVHLPVMDHRNKAIPIEDKSRFTSFEVNKTIQRALTKACALHGLGLALYLGEDLPTEEVKEVGMGNPEKNKIIRQLKTKYDIRKHANYNIEIDGKTFQFHQIMNRITNAPDEVIMAMIQQIELAEK
tara:strand:- start:1683 stop:2315 length:633 start_codon:yes stop_codon:yes gene_type:complete